MVEEFRLCNGEQRRAYIQKYLQLTGLTKRILINRILVVWLAQPPFILSRNIPSDCDFLICWLKGQRTVCIWTDMHLLDGFWQLPRHSSMSLADLSSLMRSSHLRVWTSLSALASTSAARLASASTASTSRSSTLPGSSSFLFRWRSDKCVVYRDRLLEEFGAIEILYCGSGFILRWIFDQNITLTKSVFRDMI